MSTVEYFLSIWTLSRLSLNFPRFEPGAKWSRYPSLATALCIKFMCNLENSCIPKYHILDC